MKIKKEKENHFNIIYSFNDKKCSLSKRKKIEKIINDGNIYEIEKMLQKTYNRDFRKRKLNLMLTILLSIPLIASVMLTKKIPIFIGYYNCVSTFLITGLLFNFYNSKNKIDNYESVLYLINEEIKNNERVIEIKNKKTKEINPIMVPDISKTINEEKVKKRIKKL